MSSGHEDTFHHVRDYAHFDLPFGNRIDLPEIMGLQLTKFMVLQLGVLIVAFVIFRGLAKRVASGEPVRGRWWNFWEAILVYLRDNVVRPTIGDGHHGHDDDHHHTESDNTLASTGGHPADRYLPYIWSCFIYILFCNLAGAFPLFGSPTGEINVTAALAIITLCTTILYGVQEMGPVGFLKNLAPAMDMPPAIKMFIVPMIWVIEAIGLLIKHGVLAIRLFANIMGGHTVLAAILGFIALAADSGIEWMFYAVLPASILGQVAVSMLELFVAFLQAYIFAFLATMFIGMAVHEH